MMMTREDHRRSTEWEGGFKRSAVKEKHARRRCMKCKWTYVDYIGTKGMMRVDRRWISFRKAVKINTKRRREGDIAKRK